MTTRNFPGEFEQMLLLCIAQLGEQAYVIEIRRMLGETANRSVTRGALYRTLDRLEKKGLVTWEVIEPPPERGGHPKRRFRLTEEAVGVLRTSRDVLQRLWRGLDTVLGRP